MLSQYLRRGKTIPAAALGRLPGGLIDSFHVANAMEWAPPAVFILVLFASDYATTIAFAGLGFETTVRRGSEAPVLSLERRNNAFPYDAIGDPAMDKTMSKLEVLLGRSGDNRIDQDTLFELDRQQNLVESFLGTADAIARGESVFLAQNELVKRDPVLLALGRSTNLSGFTDTDSVVLFEQDSYLTSVNLTVPLDCFVTEGDKEPFMLEINEERGNRLDFQTTSKVPNCNFKSPRASGFHSEEQVNRAEITGYVSSKSAWIYMKDNPSNEASNQFYFPPSGFPLARDRVGDFRHGRVVLGIGGVVFGNINIPFQFTTVASGSSIRAQELKQYTLVSQIDRTECPTDPSQAVDTICAAVTSLECRIFPTEYGFMRPYWTSETWCSLRQVEVLWGRNFDVDSQLIAAIAGVHSRNAGWANTRRRKQSLTLHSVPAALFMLGSIEFRASNEEVTSTSIDSIFIIFMCLPVGICVIAGLVFLLGVKHLVAIPDDGCKMIQLGAEGAGTTLDGKRTPQLVQIGCVGGRVVLKRNGLGDQQKVPCSASAESSACIDSAHDPEHSSEAYHTNFTTEDNAESTKQATGSPRQEQADSTLQCADNRSLHCQGVDGPPYSDSPSSTDGNSERDGLSKLNQHLGLVREDKPDARDSVAVHCSSLHQTHQSLKPINKRYLSFGPSGSNQTEVGRRDDTECEDQDSRHSSNDVARNSEPVVAHKRRENQPTESYKRNVLQVLSCIAFSMAVLVLGCVFVRVKRFSYSQRSPVSTTLENSLQNVEGDATHVNCFQNRLDLAAAVSAHFDGPPQKRTQVIDDYGPIEDWCVENIQDFSYLFRERSFVNEDISKWNVSNGRSFSYCFSQSSFQGDLSMWDVSQSTDFSGMFARATSFNSNLSSWNVSRGIDFSSMFHRAESFTSDLSSWDVSNGQHHSTVICQVGMFPGE